MKHDQDYEIKASTAPDVASAFDDFKRMFEAFKEDNDEKLRQLDKRGAADVITAEKVDRINRARDTKQRTIDELNLKSARPQLGLSGAPKSALQLQHKAAFDAYVRKGESSGLAALEEKALSVGSGPDGGYLVPDETERAVMLALRAISPIRSIASVQQVSGSVYKKAFSPTEFATGWVGESAARPQTTAAALAEMVFPTMELYAQPAATNTLLDDSIVNIDQWIAEEVRIAFADQEGIAFVTGDGVNKPKGFVSYPVAPNATQSWGSLGYVATGTAGALPAANPSDKLIDLVYALKAPLRANAKWVMNRNTIGVLRKLKDLEGDYLWQPAVAAGDPSTLMGYPLIEAEAMPDIAAGSLPIAFGDFARGYLIVDRVGLRVLRDPFSAKPYVLFYTTKRVGGGVQDFNAIKLMKFDVS